MNIEKCPKCGYRHSGEQCQPHASEQGAAPDEPLWNHKGNVIHAAVDRLRERQKAAAPHAPAPVPPRVTLEMVEQQERAVSLAESVDARLSALRGRLGLDAVPPLQGAEATPAMLEAGAMEIAMNEQRVMTAERKAEHVWRAMVRAAPLHAVGGQSPTVEQAMDEAIAAGDGTLHGAIDYWQERALKAEAAVGERETETQGGHLTITTNREGQCVLVSWQDDEHRILRVVWEADGPYTPHKTEQEKATEGAWREPLSEEDLVEGFVKVKNRGNYGHWFDAGVRYAEKVHGIAGTAQSGDKP